MFDSLYDDGAATALNELGLVKEAAKPKPFTELLDVGKDAWNKARKGGRPPKKPKRGGLFGRPWGTVTMPFKRRTPKQKAAWQKKQQATETKRLKQPYFGPEAGAALHEGMDEAGKLVRKYTPKPFPVR